MNQRHAGFCVVSALALFLTACPSEPSDGNGDGEDAGDVRVDTGGDTATTDTGVPPGDTTGDDTSGPDTEMDVGPDGGTTVPAFNLYYFTSGGGVLGSSNFEMRISFGAPSPRGSASGSNHRLTIAPVSP